MAASGLINLSALLDEAECLGWRASAAGRRGRCLGCESLAVIRNGHDGRQAHRQRCPCKGRGGRFDDLAGSVLAGRHQPLRVRVPCLHLMGLNLSNRQIAGELGCARVGRAGDG